jgi:hypothetical protein
MPRRPVCVTQADPDAPLRLVIAGHNRLSGPGLRKEALRGRLAIERVAGKDYTTLNAIAEMRKCLLADIHRALARVKLQLFKDFGNANSSTWGLPRTRAGDIGAPSAENTGLSSRRTPPLVFDRTHSN